MFLMWIQENMIYLVTFLNIKLDWHKTCIGNIHTIVACTVYSKANTDLYTCIVLKVIHLTFGDTYDISSI